VFGSNLITSSIARRGARLLRDGGYLVILPDVPFLFPHPEFPGRAMLGRTTRISTGAARFARIVGKPLIPFILVPRGRGWQLWCGDPIEPTDEGVRSAVEQCLRRAPQSYQLLFWEMWIASPVSVEGSAR